MRVITCGFKCVKQWGRRFFCSLLHGALIKSSESKLLDLSEQSTLYLSRVTWYLFSLAMFLRICDGLDNGIFFSSKFETVEMTTWRFFPQGSPNLRTPIILIWMHFLGIKVRVLWGFQDLGQLLETSAVFVICMPHAVCCTHICRFVSTVSNSDGQKGEILTDLYKPALAVVFKGSVLGRVEISV